MRNENEAKLIMYIIKIIALIRLGQTEPINKWKRLQIHCPGSWWLKPPTATQSTMHQLLGDLAHFIPKKVSQSFASKYGLWEGCALSLALFIIFMNRISTCLWGLGGVQFGDLRVSLLSFVADFVVLAPSSQGLRLVLEWFESMFWYENQHLQNWGHRSESEKGACLLQVRGQSLVQIEEVRVSWVRKGWRMRLIDGYVQLQ